MEMLDYLRQFNAASVFFRMTMAVICGGIIGMDREHKHRPAGFRTYMLVCMGAALTMLLGQYEDMMLHTQWASAWGTVGQSTDVSRMGAQVINGIGSLGTGTILVTGQQEVKGLTTAAGLWASACMGLAIGAGFYARVLPGLVLIFLCVRVLPALEAVMVENARNMNLYIEFASLDDVGPILSCVKAQEVDIYDVDIERGRKDQARHPSAVLSLRLRKKRSHSQVVAAIAKLECIRMIDEI